MKTTGRWGTSSKSMLLGAALVLAIAGCGSSDGENANGGGSNTGMADGGGSDGEVGDSGNGEVEGHEFCNRKAAHECAAIEPCCETSGLPYDRAGCESFIRDNCEKVMDIVRAGRRSFDEEAAETCLEYADVLFRKCSFTTMSEYLAMTIWRGDSCERVFSGTVEQGGDCEAPFECKAPADGTRTADCKGGKCVSKPRILDEGDDCIVGTTLDCAEGLFCNVNGKCQKTYAIGEPCKDAHATDACGYDARCDTTADECKALLPIGADCEDNRDCASVRCEAGRCVPITIASELVCMGPKGAD